MTLMISVQTGKVPTEKPPRSSLLRAFRRAFVSKALCSPGPLTGMDHLMLWQSAKMRMRKSALFHLYPHSMYPLGLVGVPDSSTQESLKEGSWEGMSWFTLHLPPQKCYGAQFFHISYNTLSSGD